MRTEANSREAEKGCKWMSGERRKTDSVQISRSFRQMAVRWAVNQNKATAIQLRVYGRIEAGIYRGNTHADMCDLLNSRCFFIYTLRTKVNAAEKLSRMSIVVAIALVIITIVGVVGVVVFPLFFFFSTIAKLLAGKTPQQKCSPSLSADGWCSIRLLSARRYCGFDYDNEKWSLYGPIIGRPHTRNTLDMHNELLCAPENARRPTNKAKMTNLWL